MSSNEPFETPDRSFEPESMGEPSSLVRAFDGDTAGSARPSRERAMRGRRAGSEALTGTADGRSLATFLGWFSVGLGVVRVALPPSTSTT